MRRLLIGVLIVNLFFCSISPVHAYTNEQYGFYFDVPGGWTVEEMDGVVVFSEPDDEAFIIITVDPTDYTLEQAISEIRALPTTENYTLVSERYTLISEVEAYELVFIDKIDDIDIKERAIILIKYQHVYAIIYQTPTATYDKHLATFEASLETLEIAEPKSQPWRIEFWQIWLIIALAAAALFAFYIDRIRR